jgi:hypothetical protein
LKYIVFVCWLMAFVLAAAAHAAPAQASDVVRVLVLREHGMGSATQAQPHVDKLIALFAKKNGWARARGKYITRRKPAEKYIRAKRPQFGILTLAAYLAMRKPHHLTVVGTAEVAGAGGRQYHLVSQRAADVAGCRGKKLASDHLADAAFIENVVAAGAFKLKEFSLVKTRRPVQTIKKVTRGKAMCALIDDAQLAELPHIKGAAKLRAVWSSKRLPPMAVVAFSGANGPTRAKLKRGLSSVCTGQGQSYCDRVGILSLRPANNAAFAAVARAYGR